MTPVIVHNNAKIIVIGLVTGYWLRFYVPFDTKYVISEAFPKPVSWLGMKKPKPNTTKARTHQSE